MIQIATTKSGLVKVDTDRVASYKRKEYSVTCMDTVRQLNIEENVLWKRGCYPIIEASFPLGDLPVFIPTPEEIKQAIELPF